jgi:transcription elongation factor Elf1
MARKRKTPTTIEDWPNWEISYPCPKCGSVYRALGKLFHQGDHFTCGACGAYVPISYEERMRVVSEHTQRLRDAL